MASVLKLSLKEKQLLADYYDKVKRKYEASLERGLRSLFKTIADDLLIFYSETGEIQNLDDYEADLNTMLRKEYKKTSKYFSEHYDREMQKQQDEGDNSELLAFLILLRNHNQKKIFVQNDIAIKKKVPIQSGYILNTTRNIIVDEIDKAGKVLSETAGSVPNNADIITEALPDIREKNRNRAGGIAETEIGNAESLGSQVEDDVFGDAIEDIKKNPQNAETIGMSLDDETIEDLFNLFPNKSWITELDNVVRPAHLAAHGQTKPTKEPYVVGGELLRQPRDTSIGASLGNVMRCRCISISS